MKRELWLISKHGDDAGDNAFAFFKYMRKNHPEVISIYVVDKKCYKAYNMVKNVGPVVQYNSIWHKVLYILANKVITSHVGDSEPWDYEKIVEFRKKFPSWAKRQKTIHLQHGVIDKNVSHIYDSSIRPVNLFICSTLQEMEYAKRTLHYESSNLACTGLARFDDLINTDVEKKILVIPRYRKEVMVQRRENKKKLKYHFMKSKYYTRYQSLISNKKLLRLLEIYGYELVFYPHYEVQPLIACFKKERSNVIIANMEEVELDQLLKHCCLLITDYSSVAFDFAYMRKPVIYYQFDREDFDCEYGGSYFEHERDGFGPVVSTEEELIKHIHNFLMGKFDVDKKYYERCKKTFLYHDTKNCERIFNEINRL